MKSVAGSEDGTLLAMLARVRRRVAVIRQRESRQAQNDGNGADGAAEAAAEGEEVPLDGLPGSLQEVAQADDLLAEVRCIKFCQLREAQDSV